MRVAWFSCGCSSFVAALLAQPDVSIYIHVPDQHPDTLRFLEDERPFLGRIEMVQSTLYDSVDDVIVHERYINGPSGAACAERLKKWVRQEWERKNWARHTYIWGYDADESARAERLVSSMPEFDHEFPLIERNLTKADCHGICALLGIKRPAMYDLGYPNNNCIGCVKGGKGYWNAIRRDFPDVFELRARREREIGHSCIKGVFLDELPHDAGRGKIVVPSCSMDCAMAMEEI